MMDFIIKGIPSIKGDVRGCGEDVMLCEVVLYVAVRCTYLPGGCIVVH
jgi:hypothetical protein